MIDTNKLYADVLKELHRKRGRLTPVEVKAIFRNYKIVRNDTMNRHLKDMEAEGLIRVLEDGGVVKP
jgi:hypothetical protein